MQVPIDTLGFCLDRIVALTETETPRSEVRATENQQTLPVAVSEPVPETASPLGIPTLAITPTEIASPAPEAHRADLRGGDLKLVRSRILFVRRGREVSFPPREDLISDDLDHHVFEAWKIAEFVQDLADPCKAPEMPHSWRGYLTVDDRHPDGRVRRIPPGDHKYLRVVFDVLGYYPRESLRYREDQLELLREISANLEPPRSGRDG